MVRGVSYGRAQQGAGSREGASRKGKWLSCRPEGHSIILLVPKHVG